jgi:predicted RNA-binding Zn-ribbon protein involved in translation (DUF1610 family)
MKIDLDPKLAAGENRENLGLYVDWRGNNIAFNCPVCGKVFIVSWFLDREKGGKCPKCRKSRGIVTKDGKTASIEWPV